MTRYAIYYAPRPDSELWRAGCRWLGRDALSGGALTQPEVPGIGAEGLAGLTGEAARYGWHATLKAPFVLRPDLDEGALLRRTAGLAAAFQPFALNLEVGWLDDFLALRPAAPLPRLDELAVACVAALEPMADRSGPAKSRPGLSLRQDELCRRWGYPYVFEQFRFHLTLSGSLARGSQTAAALEAAARRHFSGLVAAAGIEGVALFVERTPGGPFRYLAHCGFDGVVARHDC
ncbi:DUF1045 domain-containing protein [Pseudogulbenkiania ferrooxidans]|uniref:Phosphonate metabolism protein n=1 Tax=Pseudogulbenkiania ferrooxidans EGD-HP2 TaxID=1388764 RepID=A0ABN0N1F8_9NEIS|nr:DUF1045 domain-containing protein [Pseudogulbenkiania ferrooxidans]ERD99614.1 hypothetical protein O166_02370 [Pseudogulbenkiania ferrooxidans EGD-HP2]